VYIYDRPDVRLRREARHREMIASTEGEVSCIRFSPGQNLLAVGFLKGTILIFELNFEQTKEKPKVTSVLDIMRNLDTPPSTYVEIWNPGF